jgi:hypothetical protein
VCFCCEPGSLRDFADLLPKIPHRQRRQAARIRRFLSRSTLTDATGVATVMPPPTFVFLDVAMTMRAHWRDIMRLEGTISTPEPSPSSPHDAHTVRDSLGGDGL